MPQPVITCISDDVSGIIIRAIKLAPQLSDDTKVRAINAIRQTPPCSIPQTIQIQTKQEGEGRSGRKQKREPSAYQTFIGNCLREKKIKSFADAPAKMKECATAWRAHKGKT